MLDIVVPVYNEGETVGRLLDEIKNKVKTQVAVLIVYDFEEDSTVEALQKIRDRYDFPVSLVKNLYGRGALNAIKTGLESAAAEAVLVTMADLSDDLASVDGMYLLTQNGFDLVCGSRYMSGGRQIGGPLLKKFLSRMAGISLHYLSGIPTHDVTNSFKMYTQKILKQFKIESGGGFELGMELTIKAFVNGYKIGEVPTTWQDRTEGTSNFKMWSWMPRYIHWYLYCLKHTWLKKMRAVCLIAW